MKGIVKLVTEKNYGFVKAEDGKEYFFHVSGFNGHWDELLSDYKLTSVRVSFDVVKSPKGPRAENVSREDWPNETA